MKIITGLSGRLLWLRIVLSIALTRRFETEGFPRPRAALYAASTPDRGGQSVVKLRSDDRASRQRSHRSGQLTATAAQDNMEIALCRMLLCYFAWCLQSERAVSSFCIACVQHIMPSHRCAAVTRWTAVFCISHEHHSRGLSCAAIYVQLIF